MDVANRKLWGEREDLAYARVRVLSRHSVEVVIQQLFDAG